MKKNFTKESSTEKSSSIIELKNSIKNFFKYIGENPDREGLIKTPHRVISALDELFDGYKQNPEEILDITFMEGSCDEMVIIDDIDFISFCEHHLLPIIGKCHIGYIPNGKVCGLSKIPRLVDCYAKRLQLQERMTTQIAEAINKYLDPLGVFVVCEARHLCMIARGIKKYNSIMKTSAIRGIFETDSKARQEFLDIIRLKKI